ncbi:SDR family NAD(P)-dependent oxidoreductase [Chitinophaga caseinilytica]|uniref:SDR family NAD(P)-dependent oxidoreductase n=1 Tax=Chitinophaga caseinilytica TaxID=2267521 RepID=A0ABZ2Z5X7_9BACT
MAGLREKRISFSEKVIWITGASSGIGEALAIRLSALGARLILTSRNVEALAGVKARCVGSVVVLPADLSTGKFTVPESGRAGFAGGEQSSQSGYQGPASGSLAVTNELTGGEQSIPSSDNSVDESPVGRNDLTGDEQSNPSGDQNSADESRAVKNKFTGDEQPIPSSDQNSAYGSRFGKNELTGDEQSCQSSDQNSAYEPRNVKNELTGGEQSIPSSDQNSAYESRVEKDEFIGNERSNPSRDQNLASISPATKNSISGLAQQAISIYGRVDILINNAGIGQRASAEETSEAVLRQILELDFFAPVLLTQALLPHFSANGGQVVVTGSMAGLMGVPRRTAYAAAKHAVMGYFESLQVEHTIPGFHVTIISPGRVRTSLSLNALRGSGDPHGKMDAAQEKGIPVEVCANKMITAISRKRKHVIIAREERILWYLRKWAPPLYYMVARKFGS